jgi:hypothetical protein
MQGTASSLPRLQAAAHQPLYGVWNLGGFAHVPLEQAALAFIPAAASRKYAHLQRLRNLCTECTLYFL